MLCDMNNKRTIGLSAFRILISLLIIKNLINYLPYSEEFFGPFALSPYSEYTQSLLRYGISFLKYPFNIPFFSRLYIWLGIILCLLTMFGIFRFISVLSLFLYLVNLQLRNQFIGDGSDNVMLVTLPFLAFSDAYNFFSFRVLKIKLKLHETINYVITQIREVALFGFMIQICFIYFFTAIYKLNSDLWFNGTATYYALRIERYMMLNLNYDITENIYFVTISTYSILLFELLFSFLIWFKETKFYIILLGVIFHVGIWVFMRIEVFPWIMIGTYLVFITDDEYRVTWNKINSLVRQKLSKEVQN